MFFGLLSNLFFWCVVYVLVMCGDSDLFWFALLEIVDMVDVGGV